MLSGTAAETAQGRMEWCIAASSVSVDTGHSAGFVNAEAHFHHFLAMVCK